MDHVNLISAQTQDFIFDRQVEFLFQEQLDDFRTLTIDSTAVRSELTEKVLAYNFCRAIEIRARKQENLQRTS